jgi:hypothetical protein
MDNERRHGWSTNEQRDGLTTYLQRDGWTTNEQRDGWTTNEQRGGWTTKKRSKDPGLSKIKKVQDTAYQRYPVKRYLLSIGTSALSEHCSIPA